MIYNDISERARWPFWASRLHDLIIAREWMIHVSPIKQIQARTAADNLQLKQAMAPELSLVLDMISGFGLTLARPLCSRRHTPYRMVNFVA